MKLIVGRYYKLTVKHRVPHYFARFVSIYKRKCVYQHFLHCQFVTLLNRVRVHKVILHKLSFKCGDKCTKQLHYVYQFSNLVL